jgi:hypothetical protein
LIARVPTNWKPKSEICGSERRQRAELAEFKLDDKKKRDVKIAGVGRKPVTIESSKNKMRSKLLKVGLTVVHEDLKTEMKPENFQKWQTWISRTAENTNRLNTQNPV